MSGADGWTLTEHLLAMVVDELRVANWMRSKDGPKGRNRPKPISPWAKKPGKRYGNTQGKTTEEVVSILAKLRPLRRLDSGH